MRTLLICPRFHGIEKLLKERLQHFTCVDELTYTEADFLIRRNPIESVVCKFFPLRIRAKFSWNYLEYLKFISNTDISNYDYIFIVKPHLLFLSKQKDVQQIFANKRVISFHYDVKSRFVSRNKITEGWKNFTFEPNDIKNGLMDYCPVPYDYAHENFKNRENLSKRIHFVGAFSLFRFYRLILISLIFKIMRIDHLFVLVNGRFPITTAKFPFTSLYLSNSSRKMFSKNRIILDLPQALQSKGSNRTGINCLMFSYDVATPTWRYFDPKNFFTIVTGVIKLSKIIKSGLVHDFYIEEKHGKSALFLAKMAKVFQT